MIFRNRSIAAGGSCGVKFRADTPLVTTQRRALDGQVKPISICVQDHQGITVFVCGCFSNLIRPACVKDTADADGPGLGGGVWVCEIGCECRCMLFGNVMTASG
jgi:hypothetical protein